LTAWYIYILLFKALVFSSFLNQYYKRTSYSLFNYA